MRVRKGSGLTEEERFWLKVDKSNQNECWPWLLTTDQRGYGMFSITKREGRASHMMRSHRYSLELKEGRRLESHEEACHTCNNTICCNPNHLYVGSRQDNMNDVANSGVLKGENHARVKISDVEMREMQILRKQGISLADIAYIYNISRSQVSRLTRGLRS